METPFRYTEDVGPTPMAYDQDANLPQSTARPPLVCALLGMPGPREVLKKMEERLDIPEGMENV